MHGSKPGLPQPLQVLAEHQRGSGGGGLGRSTAAAGGGTHGSSRSSSASRMAAVPMPPSGFTRLLKSFCSGGQKWLHQARAGTARAGEPQGGLAAHLRAACRCQGTTGTATALKPAVTYRTCASARTRTGARVVKSEGGGRSLPFHTSKTSEAADGTRSRRWGECSERCWA